jgi:hypothetical protein
MGEHYEGKEHNLKFDIYHINKMPMLSRGKDLDDEDRPIIMNQSMGSPGNEHKLEYYVYDLIDENKRYKVFRLENI